MKDAAFVDSGAFIAFLDRSDGAHAEAVRLFRAPPRRLFTSAPVVSECYGWFLHRLGEEPARTFRLFVQSVPGLVVLDTSEAHRAAVDAKLDKFRGHRLTWVDASSLVVLREKRIATVWGTDYDLTIEGASVVPGGR